MLPGKQYTPADYAAMAWRRKWVILVPFAVGTYAALVMSSRLPDFYRSETLIQVVPQRVPDEYVRSTVTMRTEDRISAITEQIKSRTELERLITQMNLYPVERSRMPMQDVVELMRNRITVDVIKAKGEKDTDSFYVRFTYSDPQLTKEVTERLGALFVDVNARDRGNLAEQTNSFLQTQLAEARRRLEEQDQKLKQFRERNAGRLPTQLQFNMSAMQNTQMQIQAQVDSVARDRDRKLTLERNYADVEAEPIITPPPPPTPGAQGQQGQQPVGDTKQQLATLRESLKLAELRLKPEHPDILRTKRAIAALETRLAEETKAAEAAAAAGALDAPPTPAMLITQQQVAKQQKLAGLRAEIESLDRQIAFKEAREQQLRDQLTSYQGRIEQVPGVETEWISLTRDYDTQQAAYKELLAKSENANRAAELEQRQIGEVFRVLDPPRVPIRPNGTNRLEFNLMGAGIGLAFGLLIAALLELRDKTFRTAEDVLDVFKLPVIALVPQVVSEADQRRARRRQWIVSGSAAVVVLTAGYGFWTLQLWKHVM